MSAPRDVILHRKNVVCTSDTVDLQADSIRQLNFVTPYNPLTVNAHSTEQKTDPLTR